MIDRKALRTLVAEAREGHLPDATLGPCRKVFALADAVEALLDEPRQVSIEMKPLREDPERRHYADTGLYVRALRREGGFGTVDAIRLDKESLLAWLHSRGECNKFAEDVVGVLLLHGHLHSAEEKGE
jgi:hypothetical protein